jgi:opacity protein-like surface antigen
LIGKRLGGIALVVVFFLLLICSAANAQTDQKLESKPAKNEFGLLLGGTKTTQLNIRGEESGSVVNFGTGLTFQANYARRLFSAMGAAIYFEIPFFATPKADIAGSDPSIPTDHATLFVTPGLRFKFKPNSGLSPWLAVGGGYARFEESATRQDGSPNTGNINANKGAVQFGGGVDMHTPFRIFYPINLRFELRDILTGKPNYNVNVGGTSQHNLVFSGGLVFNF